MGTAGRVSPRQVIATLWRRAPAWRFFAMTAALLTLLFALFPPRRPSTAEARVEASADTVSYTPRAPGLPVAATQSSMPTATSPTPAASQAPAPLPATHGVRPLSATLALVTAGPAASANETGLDEALIGRQYRGSVTIDGFSVPLPPGDWASLANFTIKQAGGAGHAHFLGRIRQKRLVGAVRIFAVHSTNTPSADFPPEVKACTEPNPGRTYAWIDDQMVAHGHQACWTIRTVYATPWAQWADRAVKLAALDRAAAGDMTAKGVTYPQDFLALTFTRTETWGLLEVMYLFSPEAEGLKSNSVLSVSESDWTPSHIERYPDKVAYVEKMKGWGTAFWPKFKLAFDAADHTAN